MSELEQMQESEESVDESMDSTSIDASEETAESSGEPDAEKIERAKALGWSEKENWRGNPDDWRDYDEFLEYGERIIPVLKQNNRKLESDVTELKQTMNEMREFFKKSEQRQFEKAKQEVEAKMREAVRDGDTEAYDQYSKERDELDAPKETQTQSDVPPEFNEWKQSNSWVDNDMEAAAYANSIAGFIGQQHPTLTYREKLDKVAEEVKRRFPEKFENPRRKGAPSVESPRTAPPRNSRKKTYDNLPAEAKAQCDKFMRTIPGFTKEEYIKNYDWEN